MNDIVKSICFLLLFLPQNALVFSDEMSPKVTTRLPVGISENPVSVPRILALAWQKPKGVSDLWRSDGTLLSKKEAADLLAEIDSPNIHRPQQGYEDKVSRTLLIFFDTGKELSERTSGVQVKGKFLSDRVRSLGTFWNRKPGKMTSDRFFSVSAVTISYQSIHKLEWPKVVNLRGTYPIEEPELIKTVDVFPETVVEIAKHVTWKTKQENDGFRGILRELRPEEDDLISHFVRLYCKDEQIRSEFTTLEGGGDDGPLFDIDISAVFAQKDFDRLEFYRKRFATSIYQDITIRNDIWPK